jgi:hypothetical protein
MSRVSSGGGRDAFMVTAEDGPSFRQAARRKLILEISDRGGAAPALR